MVQNQKYISPEINVIGQNVDEATYIIDKYLDDCAISNIATIRIVHGRAQANYVKEYTLF